MVSFDLLAGCSKRSIDRQQCIPQSAAGDAGTASGPRQSRDYAEMRRVF
jgi:hypothetical protein